MKRHIIIEMDLSDAEVDEIIPSGKVWVEISRTGDGGVASGYGEILKMIDVPE